MRSSTCLRETSLSPTDGLPASTQPGDSTLAARAPGTPPRASAAAATSPSRLAPGPTAVHQSEALERRAAQLRAHGALGEEPAAEHLARHGADVVEQVGEDDRLGVQQVAVDRL